MKTVEKPDEAGASAPGKPQRVLPRGEKVPCAHSHSVPDEWMPSKGFDRSAGKPRGPVAGSVGSGGSNL